MKTTQFGINMGHCSWQACFKFHLYKQSSHINNFLLVFPQLDIMYCNYSICNYVLYRGLWLPGDVFYHNEVSSYGSTIHIHVFLGGMQMFCGHNCNCTIRTEVCGHLVMSFITIKSLHIYLLIHILGGMQMFCGHNWFIVLIRWWAEFFSAAT